VKIIRSAVNNPVAVNIFMFALIFFGIYKVFTITREFFPEADFDRVIIHTPFPGATPEEVEKGVITKIESQIEGLEGVEEVSSIAMENMAMVILKVDDRPLEEVADDVRNELDRIQDFPEDAEESFVEILEPQIPVISVVIYGTANERKLKWVAEEIKDELIALPLISKAMVSGTRQEEISIEVKPELLEAYRLTLSEVGMAVRGNNTDLAGGEIKSAQGTMLVRTLGEDDDGLSLEDIIIRSDLQGRSIRLSDIADVQDSFEETLLRGTFQGERAVQVTVFKRGDEDAVRISAQVKKYMEEKEKEFMGEGIKLGYRVDMAKFIAQRISLLSKNALQGLILVFIALALFLNLRLAFWVGTGLVVCFLGTFIFLDYVGATINLISLFGLIIVIGLIVDDAIVVAENIYAQMEQGKPAHVAAVDGAEEVAAPVVATVLTTIVAFLPLAFVDSVIGDFFFVLPIVVIAALTLSLIECFTLLPSHLAEYGKVHKPVEKKATGNSVLNWVRYTSGRLSEFKDRILGEKLTNLYTLFLRLCLRWRYVTITMALFVSLCTVGVLRAGWLPFVLFQKVDADTIVAQLEMAQGTRAEDTEAALNFIADQVLGLPGVKTTYSVVGFKEEEEVQMMPDPAIIGEVIVELKDAEERERGSQEIIAAWRDAVGTIPGASKLKFTDRAGGPPGAEIEVWVRGNRQESIEGAVRYIKSSMGEFAGVRDIEDDGGTGKLEFRIRMKKSASSLGIDEATIARQVRSAFFGFEAQVLQRNKEEVKIWIRLDDESRKSMVELLNLKIQTPTGERVPLGEVATIEMTRGLPTINRVDGRRRISITADVDYAVANTSEVTASLQQEFSSIGEKFPGVKVSFEGAKKETNESIAGLFLGYPVALILIYCILAILFKSYVQPLMVMVAIPYAIIGAMIGHLLYGLIPGREAMPITFLSLIGMVGLSGIVVNDSLILVSFINEYRRRHPGHLFKAVVEAGRRRFRPIILTSITTVLGLVPIMMETSFQAQFLIPLAISISFGLALATVLTLLLLPCLYMVLEDLRTLVHWLVSGEWKVVRLAEAEILSKEEQLTP
jgi:hydrophobic/amphiphilic exporter-1 (mainly G- bacteria), HAE1 family